MFIAIVRGRNTLAVIELIGGETTRRLSARELSGLFFALITESGTRAVSATRAAQRGMSVTICVKMIV
jgi:hypothetical protein